MNINMCLGNRSLGLVSERQGCGQTLDDLECQDKALELHLLHSEASEAG